MLSFMKDQRRWIVAVMLFAMLPMAVGCYGRFPLTNAIYKWNGDVFENKFGKSLMMWVLIIFPVYGIGMFVDGIFFNLVEFWFGKQLMAVNTTDSLGRTIALTPGANQNEATLTLSKDGQVLARHHLLRLDNRVEVRDDQGVLRGMMVSGSNGALLLTDAQGQTVQTVSPESLAALAR